MGGSEKWSVTYTKHIKQKRKVYQDGFLELDASSQKVILYDDCEMILRSRFVKKDDIIKSGETLAFDSYLVDIGDLHGDQKPLPKFNTKVTVVSKPFQSPKFGIDTTSVNRKPNLGMGKARVRNLSPSQKIIREFKKNEMNKYGSSPACLDTIKSRKMEWQVLYTTQITQKAKKYHDGILQLLIYGSQKQILLYDANRRLLDGRFLKKDEVVKSGESITFDGHLVDVGESEGDNKPLMDVNLEGRDCNLDRKVKPRRESIHSQDKFSVEPLKEASPMKYLNSETQSSIDKHNISGLAVGKNPVRAAQEILSVLKKPTTQKDVTEMERKSIDGSCASQSSHVYTFDTGNQIEQQSLQDFCAEGRIVLDLNEENNTIHKQRRSGCISENMVDTDCTNRSARPPDRPTVEPKILVAMELDFKEQQPIAPVLQDSSTDIQEKGYCNEPVSCEEDPIGGESTTSGTTIPFVEEATPKYIDQPCTSIKEFDIGCDNGYHVIEMEKSNACTPHDFCDDGPISKIAELDRCRKEADFFPSFDLGF